MSKKWNSSNQRGQGLVEYLLVVAIIAIGTFSILRVVGQNLSVQFANIALVLQDKKPSNQHHAEVSDTHYKKRSLGDFFQGAVKRGSGDSE